MKKRTPVFGIAAAFIICLGGTACKVVSPFQPNVQQGGRVEALAADPGNDNNVIAAAQTGGLFRTTDGGAKWTWINTPLYVFTDVQYAPWNTSLIVASAASDWHRVSKGGVWVSTNGGAAFAKATQADGCLNCVHKRSGLCVEMDPFRSRIYVGTDTGVYTGDAAGVNWTFSRPKRTGNRSVYSILAAANNSVIALCDDGLYESANGGDSWTKIYTKPDSVDFIGRHNNLARSPYNGNSLFMTVGYWRGIKQCGPEVSSYYSELWFSADKGRSWRVIRNRECWGSRPKFVRVAKSSRSSTNELTVYAYAGVQLRKATGTQNGNDVTFGTWSDFNMPHADIGDVCFNSDGSTEKLVGGDGGVFKSIAGTWRYTGGGPGGYNALQITEVTGQLNPATGWNLYFSTQDNDIKSSSNAGLTWTGSRCCEGFYLDVLRTTDGTQPTHFTGVACGACGNFKAETNLTNQQAWPNPPNDRGNPALLNYNSYVQNTRVDGIDSNIYMLTTDYGANWNNRFGFRETVQGQPRATRQLSPTVFIAADNLSGSVPGGVARRILKKVVNPLGPGSPIVSTINNFGGLGTMATEFAWYKVFAVNPSNPNSILITDLRDSTVKITYDGGMNWSVLRTLTDLVTDKRRLWFRDGEHCQVSAIAFDPVRTCHILVGTQQNGVFRSLNGGDTWEKIGGTEKIPYVTSFHFYNNNQVLVSSYGRGLWKLKYPFPQSCARSVSIDTSIKRFETPVVRELVTGAYVPFSDLNDAQLCTGCQYVIAHNGVLKNIRLDANQNLLSYERGNSTIATYNAQNERTDSLPPGRQNPNVPEVKNKVLEDIVKKGEPVKGFVLENGTVKALILSNRDFEPAQYRRFVDTAPQLSLQDTAGRFYFGNSGYRLNGRNWDPSVPVQLTIDGTVYEEYRAVQPDARGAFTITINRFFNEGGHTIVATQQVNGRLNEAVTSWNVPHMEAAGPNDRPNR